MTDALPPAPPRPRLIDWRRALIALPVLVAVGAAAYVFIPRGADASTRRAALADTPPAVGAKSGVHVGDAARDFVGTSPDGKAVRLSDLRGKPAIINFWATWCPSCLAEMPDLKAVQAEFGAGNLSVIAVNAGEDNGHATAFLDTLDAPAFRGAMDPSLVVSDAYGVFGLSHSVFVDSDGIIRATYSGQLSRELMKQYVDSTLAGTDAAAAPTKLRLLGNVEARQRVLEVRGGDGTADFRSKSLRCDDSYCSDGALAMLANYGGVLGIDRHTTDDPPRIVVRYEPKAVSLDALTAALADMLQQQRDPLYERAIEIVRR